MIYPLSNIGVSEHGENALVIAKLAELILKENNQALVGNTGLVDFLPEGEVCPFFDPPKCNTTLKYRTVEGECNNLKEPFYGKSFTPLARVLGSAFEDGIQAMRNKSKNGTPLKSTRFISTTIRNPEEQKLSKDFTALYVAFAQFIDHDTDHVPISGM